MRHVLRAVSTALLVVVGAVVTPGGEAPIAPAPAAADDLDDLEDRFLTTRPSVGPTFVVDVGGQSPQRILTARTLQGLVNRSSARMYVLDSGDPAGQGLLDRYVAQGLVTVVGSGNLDDALDRFGGEAAGFVVADLAEPWSVHGATVIAGLEDGFVTTPDQVPALEALGLSEIDDIRGRWASAPAAYLDIADTYGDQLPSDTLAIVRTSDTAWDFVLQQGILPVFARPGDADWSTVTTLLEDVPDGSPVYGYVSDTGDQEAVALAVLANTDLTLVPTDTTRNLSFHVAVGADLPRQRIAQPDLSDVEPCTAETLNVVVAVSDGDNMNVPLNHFLRPSNWDSPRRGDIPLGWSIGPGLAILAPAAWDIYAREATAHDELVAMIGWAYGAPSLLSDPQEFYLQSFRLMEELGMTSFWSLGGGLDFASSSYWDDFDEAADAGSGVPHTVLVGYGNATGSAFHSPAGRPAFTSRSVYSETPAQIAGHVSTLLATAPADRPLVNFLSATNWSNPVHDLVGALAPFQDQGVRFLTPAEAAACMPDAPEPEPPAERGPGTCLPDAPVTEHGLPLISDPVSVEIRRETLPFATPTSVSVEHPDPLEPGDTITYLAEITVDLDSLAADMLATRVKPIIEAGYGPELAGTGWMALSFDHLDIPFPAPAGTTASDAPAIVEGDSAATASWASGSMVVRMTEIVADTRSPGDPIGVTVSWSVTVAPDAEPGSLLELLPGPAAFDLTIDVGVVLGEFPLSGGATAAWSCLAPSGVLASTSVAAAPDEPAPTTTTSVQPATTGASTPTTTLAGGPAAASADPPRRLSVASAPAATPVMASPRYTG